MKLICFISLTLLFVLPSAAQEVCQNGVENAPAPLGLQLRMSPEQAQARFGKALKISFKTRDEKVIFQNYIDKRAGGALAGVRALYLRFFDRRLYQIEVFYEEIPNVKTLENFTELLSANQNFSVANWSQIKNAAVIDCGSFKIIADKILNPRVEATDEAVRAEVEKLRETKKKKK